MDLNEVEHILITKLHCDRIHDYDVKDDYISWLGLFDDIIPYLQSFLSNEWEIIERRRNPDNGFCRYDVKKKIIKV